MSSYYMNCSNYTSQVSVQTFVEACETGVTVFARAWTSSIELRVAVFTLLLLCAIMVWVTCLVRELVRTATTVLCTLRVCGNEASASPHNHTEHKPGQIFPPRTLHKTDGGPPPGPPPPQVSDVSAHMN